MIPVHKLTSIAADKELIKKLSKAQDLVQSIARISNMGSEDEHIPSGGDDDALDDADADVHELAKRVINAIGGDAAKGAKKAAGKKQR